VASSYVSKTASVSQKFQCFSSSSHLHHQKITAKDLGNNYTFPYNDNLLKFTAKWLHSSCRCCTTTTTEI